MELIPPVTASGNPPAPNAPGNPSAPPGNPPEPTGNPLAPPGKLPVISACTIDAKRFSEFAKTTTTSTKTIVIIMMMMMMMMMMIIIINGPVGIWTCSYANLTSKLIF